MRNLATIRGYVTRFDVLSEPIGDPPFRAIARPGAYHGLTKTIPCTVQHSHVQIATTWDRTLRIWQDATGLAIEISLPASQEGRAVRDMVASDFCAMSIGFTIKESAIFYDEDGLPCHDVSRASIDHVSICDFGAFAGAVCWLADTRAARMQPHIRAAALLWNLGRRAYEGKQAAARTLVEKFLATPGAKERFFAHSK